MQEIYREKERKRERENNKDAVKVCAIMLIDVYAEKLREV